MEVRPVKNKNHRRRLRHLRETLLLNGHHHLAHGHSQGMSDFICHFDISH